MSTKDFCSVDTVNTGLPNCDLGIGKPVLLLYSKAPVYITDADMGDLLGFIQKKTKEPIFQNRLLPISGMKQIDENSVAPSEGTLNGFGYTVKLADGSIVYTFNFPTTICRLRSIQGLDRASGYLFIMDDKGYVWGKQMTKGFRGLAIDSISVDNTNALFGDGQNVKTAKLKVNLGSDVQTINNMSAISADLDIEEIDGIQTVVLSSAGGDNYIVQTDCGNINLFDTYQTELAAIGNWKVVNMTTGLPLTLTAVSPDTTTKSFKLVLGPPLTPPYKISVSLADIATLEAAGVEGFEQTKPFVSQVS